jgi:hypothetical protein
MESSSRSPKRSSCNIRRALQAWKFEFGSFTLKNLILGSDYQLQFLVSDDRQDNGSDTLTYTSGTNTTGAINNNLGYSLLGTFVADSLTQTFTIDPGGPQLRRPTLSGFQLRIVVPAPAALPLFITGLAVLGFIVCRRAPANQQTREDTANRNTDFR